MFFVYLKNYTMNKLVFSFKIFALIIFISLFNISTSQAVVGVKNIENKEITSAEKSTSKLTKKQLRKKQRFEKRLKKFQKKWERKSKKKKRVWDEPKFRLGLLIFLVGLLVGILAFLPILGGLFRFIGGIVVFVGLALMIWSLIENL